MEILFELRWLSNPRSLSRVLCSHLAAEPASHKKLRLRDKRTAA